MINSATEFELDVVEYFLGSTKLKTKNFTKNV